MCLCFLFDMPFYWGVCGQDIWWRIPWLEQKFWNWELTYSLPLSNLSTLIFEEYWFSTKFLKFLNTTTNSFFFFKKKEPSKPSEIINEHNIVIITKQRRDGCWTPDIRIHNLKYRSRLNFTFAQRKYVHLCTYTRFTRTTSSILLNVKAWSTDWIVEWSSLALGCPSLLCQREIWAKFTEAYGDWWTWEVE